MDRNHAAEVFKIDHLRAQHRGLQLLAVVKGGVPVAERRMEAAQPDGGCIGEGITDLQALQIRSKSAGCFFVLEHELDHRLDVRRQLGRKIEIDRTVEEAFVSAVPREIRADIGKSPEQGREWRSFAPNLRDPPLVFVLLAEGNAGNRATERCCKPKENQLAQRETAGERQVCPPVSSVLFHDRCSHGYYSSSGLASLI